jgi:hypothetical protein
MLPLLVCFQRDRRVAVKRPSPASSRRRRPVDAARVRKGFKACFKSIWRRQATGSNQISAFGVWRNQARRSSARVNRMGETRWHRLPVAARSVNFFREMRQRVTQPLPVASADHVKA